jgi:hypothetical protein
MLYSGVSMRSSLLPWGNWSSKQILFNPFADDGYGHFIHWPGHDNVSDPLRESVWGGPYGPYLIDRFTTGSNGTSRIYFTLSTWNPYTTILMQADLELKSISEIPEWTNAFFITTGIIMTITVVISTKLFEKKKRKLFLLEPI